MRIAIVEDEAEQRELLRSYILQYAEEAIWHPPRRRGPPPLL